MNVQLINRRGIYKDVWGGTHPYAQYQLRSNYQIAMVVVGYLLSFFCSIPLQEDDLFSLGARII